MLFVLFYLRLNKQHNQPTNTLFALLATRASFLSIIMPSDTRRVKHFKSFDCKRKIKI